MESSLSFVPVLMSELLASDLDSDSDIDWAQLSRDR